MEELRFLLSFLRKPVLIAEGDVPKIGVIIG
jgi:hypothetical protein